MATRHRRTPEQILADAEAAAAAARIKVAKANAKDDPTLAPKFHELDALRIAIRDAKKITGGGPQSAAQGIAKAYTRISKWEDKLAKAERTLATAETRKAELETELAKLVDTFASDSLSSDEDSDTAEG